MSNEKSTSEHPQAAPLPGSQPVAEQAPAAPEAPQPQGEQLPAEEHIRKIGKNGFACIPLDFCGIVDPTYHRFTESGVKYYALPLSDLEPFYWPKKQRPSLSLDDMDKG